MTRDVIVQYLVDTSPLSARHMTGLVMEIERIVDFMLLSGTVQDSTIIAATPARAAMLGAEKAIDDAASAELATEIANLPT